VKIEEYKALVAKKKKNKYGAVKTVEDGIRFDSMKEVWRYRGLQLMKAAGEVKFFLRQVPFELTGGVKYRVDFVVFWANGCITFEDVKGYETKEFKIKKKQVEALYPIKIEVLK
jgi:hypothetical protein